MRFFNVAKITFFSLIAACFLVFANFAFASSGVNFNVDKNFDVTARNQLPAVLIKTADNLNFYVEEGWWGSKELAKQTEILTSLDLLSNEFNNKIYPVLTSVFGSEWKSGVDGDNKISVLFESMNNSEGGYFREADEYIKLQVPTSNEKEMVYLALDKIQDSKLKILLAHEFVHLITFNQKNKAYNIEEETWLNEARADYSSTILGYDDIYDGSNLQQRVNDFISSPSDSIIEWTGSKYDYASVSMFAHYLVDQYGVGIFADSLKSKYVGIDSINYALQKNGFKDSFSQIFTNWTIASFLNDCSISQRYCYLNQNLKNFRLPPLLNFLPLSGDVSLSVTNGTKKWTGNWLKFIGGNGTLKLDFSVSKELNFQVPFLLGDSDGSYSLGFIKLDKNGKGSVSADKFGTDYKTLVIIPSLQPVLYTADDIGPTYLFSYIVSISGSNQNDNKDLMQQLLDKIAALKQEIANLSGGGTETCQLLNNNLYFGMMNNSDVKCLQKFLKNQGASIYPEGLVTGNFASKTKSAVIRFQEKYAVDILKPSGLLKGTGYVGPATRQKINKILSGV
jgi:peptidoglycan hydrolase-like protein with peptidoglycan-binding domain